MRIFLVSAFLVLISFSAQAQDSTTTNAAIPGYNTFSRKTTLFTISLGLADWNKQNYKLPDSTRYGSGSGSLPVYFRLERAVNNNISIAVSLAYDVFRYNYSREGYTNGVLFYRPVTDKVSIISPGLQAFYHFNKLIPVRNLDLSVGLGIAANYIKHSNYPSSDTISNVIKPDVTLTARLAARYYINRHASAFLDIGYDKMSLLSLGVSFRFFDKHKP
ncbi:MAG: hypothetical protein JSS96_10545 [Bacteroidetes bacterium]|nr:hypothetical protein [Bacteroidota bacterium]